MLDIAMMRWNHSLFSVVLLLFAGNTIVSCRAATMDNQQQQHLATLDDVSSSDTPLFWHIPKAAGSTVFNLLGGCLDYVLAAEVGVTQGHAQDTELAVMQAGYGYRFVNVDTTTYRGIERAARMGFATHGGLADVVFTSLFTTAVDRLFSQEHHHRAVCFSVFRHPVERQVSKFYYLQDATWEPTYREDWKSITIDDFARSREMGSNWMVRTLVGKPVGPVDRSDLERAKAVLKDSCLVGIVTDLRNTLERFGVFFGWNEHAKWDTCMEQFASHGSNHHKHPKLDPASETWSIIARKDGLDMELYEFVLQLYQKQGQVYFGERNEQ